MTQARDLHHMLGTLFFTALPSMHSQALCVTATSMFYIQFFVKRAKPKHLLRHGHPQSFRKRHACSQQVIEMVGPQRMEFREVDRCQ